VLQANLLKRTKLYENVIRERTKCQTNNFVHFVPITQISNKTCIVLFYTHKIPKVWLGKTLLTNGKNRLVIN